MAEVAAEYEGGVYNREQRNSFLVSLLVLSAAVMKSDGKVMKSELEYVKDFIRRSFGEAALPQALQILKAALEKDIDLPQVCAQIKLYNLYSTISSIAFLGRCCGSSSA